MWRGWKRSEDRGRLVLRWALTLVVLAGLGGIAAPAVLSGGLSAVAGLMVALILGLALAIIWTPSIAAWLARPFENLYTGGERPADPAPSYSAAQARRANGQPREAIYLIREQLERFPNDFRGQMMIAEIQARDLNDLPGAEMTVLRLLRQDGHPAASLAFALNTLADWHLALAKDPEAATRCLEKIQELFPDSEHALQAAQRLAHMASPEFLHESVERRTIPLKAGIANLGLKKVNLDALVKTSSPEEQARELTAQLEKHPLDIEAREKLALLYAHSFQRLDLAAGQLEQLIQCPHLPPKQTAYWLNMLADLQLNLGRDLESARATLQRIIDLFPAGALAAQAQSRLAALPAELKDNTPPATIKLGVYEKYLGLKMKRPAPGATGH